MLKIIIKSILRNQPNYLSSVKSLEWKGALPGITRHSRQVPKETRNAAAASFMGPKVSKVAGKNSCVKVMPEYFATFSSAAFSATLPAEEEDRWQYDEASVSATVTFQTRHLPENHEIWIRPSGRLPSKLSNLGGSLTDSTPALTSALKISSFRALCL